MYKLQEISDRLEIQDLLMSYCEAIDTREWKLLNEIFTDNAIIDFTEAGGIKGNLKEIKLYLEKALKPFLSMQHMMGLPKIEVDGLTAQSKTMLFNPMVIERNKSPHTFFVGLWYFDKLVKISGSWKIASRYESLSYFHNVPEDFVPISS
ncbi:nuclear transport factor 2 family protein [Hellea sp.]|nr:nuclear transport factor 2 family protein [Hellea sp.]